MSKKKTKSKLNQTIICRFSRLTNGVAGGQNQSMFEFSAKGLEKLGFSRDAEETAKEFCRRHEQEIIDYLRSKSSVATPSSERVVKSAKTKKSHQTKIKEIAGLKLEKYSHPLLGKEEYQKFYTSTAWRQLRYLALKNTNGQCQCCGARASDGVSIHVDHIKPRSRYPKLELSLDNLQVLCQACNVGKGDWDTNDWREHWKAL
jgi:5-methylcytosine-specific restriction endonuclease McrA